MDAIPLDLSALENLTATKTEIKQADNRIRVNALQEVAVSMGARNGLAWRTKQISEGLYGKTANLDKVFDFRRLLISSSPTGSGDGTFTILPPVILEAKNVTVADGELLRISDRVYKVESQARFVTNPPTWRDYLLKDFPVADTPNRLLLPRDEAERREWKVWVNEGWAKGVSQADAIFELNLARLKRDMEGMAKYRALLNMNMVSRPYVAEARNGVTGGGNEMAVDDRSLRITALPSLNAKPAEWKPMIKIQGPSVD